MHPLPASFDPAAFSTDLDAVRVAVDADMGPHHLAHLKKIERWGRACSALGYATSWVIINPLSPLLIALGSICRWLLQHEISHGGYDGVPGIPARYTSKHFAQRGRRFLDWPDWIIPAAWHHEHDLLHHYRLGEESSDPDVIERNTRFLRAPGVPRLVRYAVLAFIALTWKATYYAPSTLASLENSRARRTGGGRRRRDPLAYDCAAAVSAVPAGLDPRNALGRQTWLRCLLPYAAFRFGLLPALFLPLGTHAWLCVLVNSLLAEAMTNVHSFAVIAPNHTGADLYRFEGAPSGKADFRVRQVLGSANYRCGTDLVDFSQAWLNYQIEHHLWPDLTMLGYRLAQPLVAAVCGKHGVPYVQGPVLDRARKMVSIVVGDTAQPLVAAPRAHSASAAA